MCASSPVKAVLRGVAAALCSLLLVSAWAQQQPTREQEQLRRLRLQVQQLQQNQATQQEAAQRAEADKAAARDKLDAVQAQADKAQAELRRSRQAVAAQTQLAETVQRQLDTERQERAKLQERQDQLQAELLASKGSVERLSASGAGLQQRLDLRQAGFADLAARHAVQAQGLQTCINNNQALRDIGEELAQRYATKSVADVVAQNEPFLQFRRVVMENLLQGYQDKLDAQAFKAPPAPAAPDYSGRPRPPEPARAP